jgi:23S rRNA U2552 (ribose-2'-O)-methylase RlmE/FtsJ
MRSRLTELVASDSVSESNENLIGFIASTVEKLSDDVATISAQMATKEYLARLDGRLSERLDVVTADMARMREEMATKEDLARLDGRFSERLQVATTGIRGDIEQVQLRLDSMEHGITSRFEHVEGEISRLRSAVYILGKDRPEVLRLLGQPT